MPASLARRDRTIRARCRPPVPHSRPPPHAVTRSHTFRARRRNRHRRLTSGSTLAKTHHDTTIASNTQTPYTCIKREIK